MKSETQKRKLLEQLKRMPIIELACQKTGIGRQTYYRWRSQSETFRKEADEALVQGEAFINDLSESNLIALVGERHWPSIHFWLSHRHPKFKPKVEIDATIHSTRDELTLEEKQEIERVLGLETRPSTPSAGSDARQVPHEQINLDTNP